MACSVKRGRCFVSRGQLPKVLWVVLGMSILKVYLKNKQILLLMCGSKCIVTDVRMDL